MDEIELRIRKAEKLIQDAKKEFEMSIRGVVVPYYAMFHATKAMLLSLGKDSKTHRRTIYLRWENKEKWISLTLCG